MVVVPYSMTPEYTTEINDDDVFILDVHGLGDMKQISVKNFFKPIYDRITAVLASMYKYMGSVNTYEDLPVYEGEQNPIPVYGILHGEHAGNNYVWVVDKWQEFMSDVDLSNYVSKTELDSVLESYTQVNHTHSQDDITDLNVVSAIREVQTSTEDAGQNIFAVDKTDGSTKQFIIRNGRRGSDAISYRLTGLGSVTKNHDGSYSPTYLYIQAQKVAEITEDYVGRILISTQVNNDWVTLYPNSPENWTDTSNLEYHIPDNVSNLRVRLYESGTSYQDAGDSNVLYEEVVSITIPGIPGLNAKTVSIKAGSYVFHSNESGVVVAPNEINFSVDLQNIEGDIDWVAKNGDVVIKEDRSPTFKITSSEMYNYSMLSIIATCSGISDKCTIIKVEDGTAGIDGISPLTILASNESFNIPVNSNNVVLNAFSVSTEFVGYRSDQIQTATISSVSGLPAFMTYRSAGNTIYFDIAANTLVSINNGQITINVECDNLNFTKKVNWTLSKQGLSSKNVFLHASSYVFNADADGEIHNPATIVFTVNAQNLSATPSYIIKNGSTVIKSGVGTTFSLTSLEMSSYDMVVAEVTCEGYSDSCTVVKVTDGFNGITEWHEVYTNPVNHEDAQSSDAFVINEADMDYSNWSNEICVEYSTFDNSSVSISGQETYPDQGTMTRCFTPVIPVGFANETVFEFTRTIGDYRFIQTITVDSINKSISFSDLMYDKVARTSSEIRGEALASNLSPGYILSTYLWPVKVYAR